MQGCYVTGLYLEGARWDPANRCLARSTPKVLVEPLPVLSVVPIEVHRLKLQVSFIVVVLCLNRLLSFLLVNIHMALGRFHQDAYVSPGPCSII